MKKFYVYSPTTLKDYAAGYVAGLNTDEDEDVEYELVVDDEIKPGKLYITDKDLR